MNYQGDSNTVAVIIAICNTVVKVATIAGIVAFFVIRPRSVN